MSRIVIRALLAAALAAPLLPHTAEGRRMHTLTLRCNVDGTYTCGGECKGKWCCEMNY